MQNGELENDLESDLVKLINDIYNDMLTWLPSFLGKRLLVPHKVKTFSERITKLSQKYVEAKLKQHEIHKAT